MDKKNLQILKYVFWLFLGWRISLFFIGYFGLSTFPHMAEPTIADFPTQGLDYWIKWANWDGGHFRGIAEVGYLPIQTVFFPLYPILIKFLMLFGIHSLWGGMIISNLCLIVTLFFVYKLVSLDFKEEVAKKAVFAVLIFPTSFYLGAVYSESLFLAAVTAAYYFARIKKWPLSAFFVAICIATRLVGIAVLVGILAEYLFKDTKKFKTNYLINSLPKRLFFYSAIFFAILVIVKLIAISHGFWFLIGVVDYLIRISQWELIFISFIVFLEMVVTLLQFKKIFTINFFLIILSILPIPLYIFYQQIIFSTPFSFLTNESLWHRSASFPWDPVWAYFTYLLQHNFFQTGNLARTLTEFLFFIGGVIGFIISLYKLRPSYTIFYLLTLTIPLFSGTLIAIPRYILVIFPIYILLALVENEYLQKFGIILFTMLLAAYLMLFINSYWVT